MDASPHVALGGRSGPAPDAGPEGLVSLLDELVRRTTRAATTVVGDGRDLRLVAWAEQDPYVLRLLGEAATAYLELDTEHQRVEVLRRGLEHLATHDALTGLPNRTLLLERVERALVSASGSGGRVGVLFLDVDGFKQINDTLGHAYGDIVLIEVAARLRRAARDGETVGRMSGDEFVVVCEDLPGAPDDVEESLRALARRFAGSLSRPSPQGAHEVVVSVSIGATVGARLPGTDAAGLLRTADAAMYASKRAGGGRLTIAATGAGLRTDVHDPGAAAPP